MFYIKNVFDRCFLLSYPSTSKEEDVVAMITAQKGYVRPSLYCSWRTDTNLNFFIKYTFRRHLFFSNIFDVKKIRPEMEMIEDISKLFYDLVLERITFWKLEDTPLNKDFFENYEEFEGILEKKLRQSPLYFNSSNYLADENLKLYIVTPKEWFDYFNKKQLVFDKRIKENLKPLEFNLDMSNLPNWEGYRTLIEYIKKISIKNNSNKDRIWTDKHLFIIGGPNSGKTALIKHLEYFFRVYNFDALQPHWIGYENYNHNIIDWSEFTLIPKIIYYGDLLKILKRELVGLPFGKGKPKGLKKIDSPAIIFSSNFNMTITIERRFVGGYERKLFREELLQYITPLEIPTTITLYPFIEHLMKFTKEIPF